MEEKGEVMAIAEDSSTDWSVSKEDKDNNLGCAGKKKRFDFECNLDKSQIKP